MLVAVVKAPVVGVMSTGDELAEASVLPLLNPQSNFVSFHQFGAPRAFFHPNVGGFVP